MADEEFDAFLRYLGEEYIAPRLPLVRHRFRHHFDDEVIWALDRLREAHQALGYIQDTAMDDGDIYRTFTLDALAQVIAKVSGGVKLNNRLAEESGVMGVLDEHFTTLASGLRADHLPAVEADMLSSLGFPRAAAHLPALVYKVRVFSQHPPRSFNEVPVSQQLRLLADRLDGAREEHTQAARSDQEDRPPSERRKRKWWTGLGKVVTGAAMSIADIALGAGVIPFEVPPETRSWGALSSATVGIGQVLEGVGACRGE